MSESKNFNLNNINDCVDLLTLMLERSNAKGIYSLQESAWAYTCINNIKTYIKSQQDKETLISQNSRIIQNSTVQLSPKEKVLELPQGVVQQPIMQSKDGVPYPSLLPPLGLNNNSSVTQPSSIVTV
jgi:hypothetical protein